MVYRKSRVTNGSALAISTNISGLLPSRPIWRGSRWSLPGNGRPGLASRLTTSRARDGKLLAGRARRVLHAGGVMRAVDAKQSPFYSWLDRPTIRSLVREARALSPGERLVLIKGLIPGLVEDMGDAAVRAFIAELDTKAERYAEAV